MTGQSYLEIAFFFLALLGISPILGAYISSLFAPSGPPPISGLHFLNKWTLRWIGSAAQTDMDWKRYTAAVLSFSFFGFVLLLLILLSQSWLPLNPQNLPNVPFWLAVNTAVSFVTNTNWQAYSGESTLSYFSQMVGLTTQNFVSAATGIAVMVALARGLRTERANHLGNFWKDLSISTIYLLLPLSMILAIVLVSEGVVQNLSPYITAKTSAGVDQLLPMGPAASQVAIKQLGTNGGGFFGVNSAHPFENPTPLSNFLQLLAILLIPAALPFSFGRLVGSSKHGLALFAAMLGLFLLTFIPALVCEHQLNPALGGVAFMEGKEVRIGVGMSTLWASATTVASNGSVNSMLSSFSPIAGGLSLLNIMMGEVVFGGVGSGVYGMALFVILTVFIAGLMVGRTPEYLGKKIEATEIRYAVLGVVLPSAVILIFSAIALVTPSGLSSILSTGPHGLSEVLYTFTSGAGNNGSAFAGLNANTAFYNSLMSLAMILGRFGVIIPVLGIAGSVVTKRRTPTSAGTFSTEGFLFIALLCSIVLIFGALTFFPALSLGPVMEHLLMIQGRTL